MLRILQIGFFVLLFPLWIHAADIPDVLILSDDINSSLGALLQKDMEKSLVFTVKDKLSKRFVCDWKLCENGSSDVLSYLKSSSFPGKISYRVLLISCGLKDILKNNSGQYTLDEQEYRKNLSEIVAVSKKPDVEILWVNNSPVQDSLFNEQLFKANRIIEQITADNSIYVVDYRGFIERIMKESGSLAENPLLIPDKKKSEFLSESLSQWWTAAAKSNHSIQRIKLWEKLPPYYEKKGEEQVNSFARIDQVAVPELECFLPQERKNAIAVIFFPGGGYQYLGFLRNARELSEIMNEYGIAVFGLKYRTKRKPEVSLEDAQRAVRYVRAHAAEWGLDSTRIGVAGQSAGANLVMNLCSNYSEGNPEAGDPVEKESSRPSFAAVFSSWNFLSNDLTFEFKPDIPPFFVRHAKNDNSFLLAERLVDYLQKNSVPANVLFLENGGHGAFEISEPNPGKNWPSDFAEWLIHLKN